MKDAEQYFTVLLFEMVFSVTLIFIFESVQKHSRSVPGTFTDFFLVLH